MNLYATKRTYVPRSAGVKKEDITNRPGDVVFYDGPQVPTESAPASMSSEIFNYVWSIYQKVYEISGVSQLSAMSVKPVGIESGKALRTLINNEAARFAVMQSALDDVPVELAKAVLRCADQVGSLRVRYAERSWMEELDYGDIRLDESSYVIKVYPTNFLSVDPAGRKEDVADLIKLGIIKDERIALQLLDAPDLEQFKSLKNAQLDMADRVCEMVLDHGKIPPRLPSLDPQIAQQRIDAAILEAILHDAPTERVEALQDWLADHIAGPIPTLPNADQAQPMPQQPTPTGIAQTPTQVQA